MSNIIDSIQLSGTVYILSAQTSGSGNPTVELTQAEYDALVTAGTVQADTYYIITDAQGGDLSNYMTSAQTMSAITEATSGLQVTLTAGTGIDITDNVISATGGGGGGKAIEAGRGISVTTGETADTVSFNLALSAGTSTESIIGGRTNTVIPVASFAFGGDNSIYYDSAYSSILGYNNKIYNGSTAAHIVGSNNEVRNGSECAVGKYNTSSTGSTDADKSLFSVGNGTADNARHNAFEIRRNGDIYITSGGTDIKLQDNLGGGGGGGGSSYTAGRGIDITNDTISFSLPISAGTGTGSIVANGNSTKATGSQSFAEGYSTSATSQGAHSEGMYSKATNTAAHAEGNNTTASATYSHAEGNYTKATGYASHAEGDDTAAGGQYSHSEGLSTSATTVCSHTEGSRTIATNANEHASGTYNVSNKANTTWGDSGNTLFSVGNGTADNARHNAFEIRQNGDVYLNDGTNDVKLQDYLQIKVVKLTQSAYDALSPDYDSNTLYVIVN